MSHYTEQQVAERIGLQGGPVEIGFAIRRGDLPINDDIDEHGGRLWDAAKFDSFAVGVIERFVLTGRMQEGQR